MIEMDDVLKTALVDAHNEVRNSVALGCEEPYESAANMNELIWNQDLSNLCLQNVRQCKMEHDNCKPGNKAQNCAKSGECSKRLFVGKYRQGGQNLAVRNRWSTNKLEPVDVSYITRMVKHNWFAKEKTHGNMTLINYFNVEEDDP